MPSQETPRPHGPVPLAPRPGVNRLLASFGTDLQERLSTLGSRVRLEKSAVIAQAGAAQMHVYFPCSGLLSLQTMTQNGNSVEVAMVGREGVAALSFTGVATAAYTIAVTVPGDALKLRADAFQSECERNVTLQRSIVQHLHRMMSDIANGSACNRFHTARQRLARWLLMASDRIQSSRVELTQEQLAEILGLQRTGVTVANVALQDAGAITSRHGRIRIIDRARLQQAACECYQPMR
jgi:CRP-like cAMP-binding protein